MPGMYAYIDSYMLGGDNTHLKMCVLISCRPMILSFAGLRISDFSNKEEAMQTADGMIEANQARYGWSFETHPPITHETNPLLSEFYYVNNEGTSESFKVEKKEELYGDKNVKDAVELEKIMHSSSMSMLDDANPEGPAVKRIKAEYAELPQLKEETDKLKSSNQETIEIKIHI